MTTLDERTAARNDAMPTTRGMNFYRADANLSFVLRGLLAPADLARLEPWLDELGELAGGELDALAFVANANPPTLRQYDEAGQRVDEVVYHPAYEQMERIAFGHLGLAAMSHRPGVRGWPGVVPHTAKYALSYLFAQSEFGLLCPVNMTDSAARTLRRYAGEELQARYLPRLTSQDLESLWQGAMFMTERGAGSDVGAATTVAEPEGDHWLLAGDKWFCSNVDAGVILTLARPVGAPDGTRGLGLFLVPRELPDGSRNRYTINRLKDKLGTRSMASGEVTYDRTVAYLVGELERGFVQMAEMINASRLSNAMRAAAMMRRSYLEATVYAKARAAFGRALADLPLMREDLFQMLLDVEAAAAVVFHTAATWDRADLRPPAFAGVGAGDERPRALLRIMTPLAKCWTTERGRAVAVAGMDARGGNGYVEDWINARLVRDSHLGSIWEGTTNVVALDTLRAIRREGAGDALLAELRDRLAGVRSEVGRRLAAVLAHEVDRAESAMAAAVAAPPHERDLRARPLAERLYHCMATTFLLEEGEGLIAERGDAHKHLVATAYLWRAAFASPRDALDPDETGWRWWPVLEAWEPVPADACEPLLAKLEATPR